MQRCPFYRCPQYRVVYIIGVHFIEVSIAKGVHNVEVSTVQRCPFYRGVHSTGLSIL